MKVEGAETGVPTHEQETAEAISRIVNGFDAVTFSYHFEAADKRRCEAARAEAIRRLAFGLVQAMRASEFQRVQIVTAAEAKMSPDTESELEVVGGGRRPNLSTSPPLALTEAEVVDHCRLVAEKVGDTGREETDTTSRVLHACETILSTGICRGFSPTNCLTDCHVGS
jgi:hypothetical protein